jgi:hypothetical protein
MLEEVAENLVISFFPHLADHPGHILVQRATTSTFQDGIAVSLNPVQGCKMPLPIFFGGLGAALQILLDNAPQQIRKASALAPCNLRQSRVLGWPQKDLGAVELLCHGWSVTLTS